MFNLINLNVVRLKPVMSSASNDCLCCITQGGGSHLFQIPRNLPYLLTPCLKNTLLHYKMIKVWNCAITAFAHLEPVSQLFVFTFEVSSINRPPQVAKS